MRNRGQNDEADTDHDDLDDEDDLPEEIERAMDQLSDADMLLVAAVSVRSQRAGDLYRIPPKAFTEEQWSRLGELNDLGLL